VRLCGWIRFSHISAEPVPGSWQQQDACPAGTTAPAKPPTKGTGGTGTRGDGCPLKSFPGSGCSAPCRTEPWGLQLFISQWIALFYPPGTVGPDRVTWGGVQPCLASLLCPSCPQAALGTAWPGGGGSSKHPRVDPPEWDPWEVLGWPGRATLGPCPLWGPAPPASVQGEHPMSPASLRAVVSCGCCATRGQHCLHQCHRCHLLAPHPWPLGAPRRARLGLGWAGGPTAPFLMALGNILLPLCPVGSLLGELGAPCPHAHQSVCPGTAEQGPVPQHRAACGACAPAPLRAVPRAGRPSHPTWRCPRGRARPELAPEEREHQWVTRGRPSPQRGQGEALLSLHRSKPRSAPLPAPLPSPRRLRSINSPRKSPP